MAERETGIPIILWMFAILAMIGTTVMRTLQFLGNGFVDGWDAALFGINVVAVGVVVFTRSRLSRIVYTLVSLGAVSISILALFAGLQTTGDLYYRHIVTVLADILALAVLWSAAASRVLTSAKNDKRAGGVTFALTALYAAISAIVFLASEIPLAILTLAFVLASGATFVFLKHRYNAELQ